MQLLSSITATRKIMTNDELNELNDDAYLPTLSCGAREPSEFIIISNIIQQFQNRKKGLINDIHLVI